MSRPIAPELPEGMELTQTLDIDLNTVINPLMAIRSEDPIAIPSKVETVREHLPLEMPRQGQEIEEVLAQLDSLTGPYCRRNTHPGFMGYVPSGGLPVDPLGHAMVAALNQNTVGYPASPAGATIERTVIRWLCDLAGYPADADGVFLSGGSIANLTGMGVAMVHCLGEDYRSKGLIQSSNGRNPVIICSKATHFSVTRAAALLGIGSDNVIAIETDDQYRMRMDSLADVLEKQDCVICVVASAGTTTTGAIDPIPEIAALCKQKKIWLHVDAAYGGGALLSEELRPLFNGIDQADSITIDLHKWFFNAIDSSVVLYRDPSWSRKLFYERSDYISFPIDGPPEQHMFFHLGPELSRRLRALPAYIALSHYGAEKLGRNVFYNVECARYLHALVEYYSDLEVVAAPQLSIFNFRYVPQNGSGKTEDNVIDEINRELRLRIEREGSFLMSETNLDGRPVLRACITNHATRHTHIDALINQVREVGEQISQV